ncbi:hypothetical protein BDV96DRAFT_552220 [Lophiotrema nucula]|uniref:Amino-acid acetyltransferase, mitochondrial n=1 Tax=Lophiotrema nucula TaxID=690887 RepID=A0A6A5YV80_9PLEO|nr:hypothetical protein BDV96DRAFT_552220 [Lophiotrema nucula]
MIISRKAQRSGLRTSASAAVTALQSHHDACQKPSPSSNTLVRASPFSTTSRCASEPLRSSKKSAAKERQRAERDQLIKLVKESPGKRDAKNFLKHFDAPHTSTSSASPTRAEVAHKEKVQKAHHDEWRLTRTGVNLGNLYEPTKAIQENPVFTQQPLPETRVEEAAEVLHLALVKLREPQTLDDGTLGGIALTLSQMVRLGLNIAVVVDCDTNTKPDNESVDIWEELVREQTARIVDALEEYNQPGAFEVGHVLSWPTSLAPGALEYGSRGALEVRNSLLLAKPLEEGIIPVIPPIAYDTDLRKLSVNADDVLLALTREFSGLNKRLEIARNKNPSHEDDDPMPADTPDPDSPLILLDRVIILDPLGGLPSSNRADGAHVFVNLDAEWKEVQKELRQNVEAFSKLWPVVRVNRHVKNLDAVHGCLRILPPSSSALIITPAEAAISSQSHLDESPSTAVRTRRTKNPLIHNLLTDKPMISSSLPAPLVNRTGVGEVEETKPNPATFLKRGIPVTVVPPLMDDGKGWQPPSKENPSIDLKSDPRIDFPRLLDLIEDSFRRKLDVDDYLNRIRGRVAGVIIAGNYEGGAICTWETPPSLNPTTTSPSSQPTPSSNQMWIPYLDKFAVKTQSQGSGGVADIVWGALTRSCFPNGVVWRSRTDNPVNKWYFERAVGMWDLPLKEGESNRWTMFWTGEGVTDEWARLKEEGNTAAGEVEASRKRGMTNWDAYVDVCHSVKPSWADKKAPD